MARVSLGDATPGDLTMPLGQSDRQPLRSPSLGLRRGIPIYMYQYLNTKTSNIWRHTSLQHDNQNLDSFFPLLLVPNPKGLLHHPPSTALPPWRVKPRPGVLRHHLQWPMTTTRDNRNIDNDDATTTELAADVVAPVVTPPPPPLTAPTTTPCGPSTSTPGPAPFRSELVSGERGGGSTSSSLSHRPCCPTLSSTVSLRSRPTRLLCRPWCIYPDGVGTVDDPQRPPLWSSSTACRPNLRAAPAVSTTGIVATVDVLLEPAGAGSLFPHHDDGSSYGHRLGYRFRHLQPHHFQCW
jgi:hypothetical protein